jgi:hypothetical protein
MDAYQRAWTSNDPGDIASLFTDDGVYLTEPYADAWRGRDAIVAGWLAHSDEPATWKFDWQPLVETDGLCVVTGATDYGDRKYSNLWVIRLAPDGRASEFTEWYMQHP